MKLKLLLPLLLAANLPAQFAPPPPMPPPIPCAATRFTLNCPHCLCSHHGLIPTSIITNGYAATNGGNIIQRTLEFACPKSRDTIRAQNTKFIPEAIAIEEENGTPASAGSEPSLADLLAADPPPPTWTTDPNLHLSIILTNCTSDSPFRAAELNTILIVPDNITSSVICGPLVCVHFFTETNKTYTCQASDDGSKTWLDGIPVIGSGLPVTFCEVPLHPHRIYRVVESSP